MSKIQWTDVTWNPVTGCTKVSAGCKNCYAERDWGRVYGAGAPESMRAKYGVRKFGDVMCHHDRLDQPLRWQKPRRVFVNSMSDLFHEDVPESYIDKVFGIMAMSRRHTFQVLTKRPERMRDYLLTPDRQMIINNAGNSITEPPDNDYALGAGWPIENVWLGVSCEDQKAADERVPVLLDTPAALRFVSAEPLIGAIDLEAFLSCYDEHGEPSGPRCNEDGSDELSWVIVGGESGPGARPCDVEWIRSIVGQCRDAGVACFVKQLGAEPGIRHDDGKHSTLYTRSCGFWPEGDYGNQHSWIIVMNDRKGGKPHEWPVELRVREWPRVVGGAS